jgi:DNA invertase Pin-like site-specific DNA recombinase
MNFNQMALELARMRQEELIAEAAQARRVGQRPSTIRRFVGRRVIAVGQRIAAEPRFELARSR